MIEHLVTNPNQLERDFVESKGIFRWFGEPPDAGCICLIKQGPGWTVYDNHAREIPDFITRINDDPGLHSWDGLNAAWQGCKTEDERRALLQPYVQVQKEYDDLCNVREHDEQTN